MKNLFVFNVLVYADKEWFIYTQCDSAECAEKRREQFVAETPHSKYHSTLITFTARPHRMSAWEKFKNWE